MTCAVNRVPCLPCAFQPTARDISMYARIPFEVFSGRHIAYLNVQNNLRLSIPDFSLASLQTSTPDIRSLLTDHRVPTMGVRGMYMYMCRAYEYTGQGSVQNTYDSETVKEKEPRIGNSAVCRISGHIHMILCYGVRPHLQQSSCINRIWGTLRIYMYL